MDGEDSTPIENVLEIEKSHADEANAALAELSGESPNTSASSPSVAPLSPNASVMYGGIENSSDDEFAEEDDDVDESGDMWMQMILTVLAVGILVFLFFSPKIRVMLEPVIGTGYLSLAIRSVIIGVFSIIPQLLLM